MKKQNVTDDFALLVLDPGNNYTKCTILGIQDGEVIDVEFSFPYGYIPLNNSEWEQEVLTDGTLSRRRNKDTYSFKLYIGKDDTGEPQYLPVKIGHGAFNSTKNAPLLGSTKYVPGGIESIVAAALLKAFPNGHKNVILAYGIPPTEWRKTHTIHDLLIKTIRVRTTKDKRVSWKVKAGMAYDENASGLVYAMSIHDAAQEKDTFRDTNGKFATRPFEPGQRIIVIDMGGWLGSIAYADIEDNGFAVIDYDSEIRPIEGGAITLRDSLRNSLRGHFEELSTTKNKNLTDLMMDKVLQTGKINIGGQEHDAEDAIRESLTYLKDIKMVFENVYDAGTTAAHILLTGGTADMLRRYIPEFIQHNSIIYAGKRNELYLSNVRGGRIIAVEMMKKENMLPEILLDILGKRW